MTTRKGLGKGRGSGYRNIIPRDPRVHSDAAHGVKQPQWVTKVMLSPHVAIRGLTPTQKKELIERVKKKGLPASMSYREAELVAMGRGGKAPDRKQMIVNELRDLTEKLNENPANRKEILAKIKSLQKEYRHSGKARAVEPEENAVRELELYTYNNADVYRQMRDRLENNLKEKMKKGTYDREKGRKGFLNVVNFATDKYTQEFGREGDKIFTAADRREAAKRLEQGFYEEQANADKFLKALGNSKNRQTAYDMIGDTQ